MSTIKKAVLALAETHPELAAELAKETGNIATARDDTRKWEKSIKGAIQQLHNALKDLKDEELLQARWMAGTSIASALLYLGEIEWGSKASHLTKKAGKEWDNEVGRLAEEAGGME